MLRDSSAPTDPASGVLTSDHPRPDTDPPDPGHLHDPPHSPSAMDISLPDFPALTLNPAPPGMPPGMHVPSSVPTPIAHLASPRSGLVSYKDTLMAAEPMSNLLLTSLSLMMKFCLLKETSPALPLMV
ncbi:hypothetical protein V6N12_023641 [Hibiscus sabdariffa]|uniref:Uncharacterized protein n=1 Tax=Hibiscus sabdariffa TaxID=183260 RepID=A0ABR2FYN4_9ROSI